jgi:hypothetical protein
MVLRLMLDLTTIHLMLDPTALHLMLDLTTLLLMLAMMMALRWIRLWPNSRVLASFVGGASSSTRRCFYPI